jgi:hypothetical protein
MEFAPLPQTIAAEKNLRRARLVAEVESFLLGILIGTLNRIKHRVRVDNVLVREFKADLAKSDNPFAKGWSVILENENYNVRVKIWGGEVYYPAELLSNKMLKQIERSKGDGPQYYLREAVIGCDDRLSTYLSKDWDNPDWRSYNGIFAEVVKQLTEKEEYIKAIDRDLLNLVEVNHQLVEISAAFAEYCQPRVNTIRDLKLTRFTNNAVAELLLSLVGGEK